MRVRLLFPDRDHDPKAPACFDWETLVTDLELARTLDVMAGADDNQGDGTDEDPAATDSPRPTGSLRTSGRSKATSGRLTRNAGNSRRVDRVTGERDTEPDPHIRQVCQQVLLSPLQSAEDIAYRQAILRDVLDQPEFARALYRVVEDVTHEREFRWNYLDSHETLNVLLSADELLHIFIAAFKDLGQLVQAHAGNCHSAGLQAFNRQIRDDFGEDYLAEMSACLATVSNQGELLIGAGLGSFLQGTGYRPLQAWNWREKWQRGHRLDWLHPALAYTLTERDELGAKDFSQRRARALSQATNILAQAAERLANFFRLLDDELAFYIGCLNLSEALRRRGLATCFPQVLPFESRRRRIDGLYECSLAVGTAQTAGQPAIIGNDLHLDGQPLTIITGANQGGKSTFLRSIGQAQLMAQAGLFVTADACETPLRQAVLTHFKKEEDKQMEHGKLDEELSRMDGLADHLGRDCLILFNESFASTNEREGSEIHAQIVRALVRCKVEVVAVTHLYDFAEAFMNRPDIPTLFLRAQRADDGSRPYRVEPGQPLRTAYGLDLYARIFREAG